MKGPTARQVEVAEAVRRHGGNQARAAAELGISRPTVTRSMKLYRQADLSELPRAARRIPRARRASLTDDAILASLRHEAVRLTSDQVLAGRGWWGRARDDVAAIAARHGQDPVIAGVAAAVLSPGLRWSATLEVLDGMLAARARGDVDFPRGGHATFGYRDRRKAWQILQGGAVALCSGPKVSAVARCLAGDLSAVPVDRHVARAAGAPRQPSPGLAVRVARAVAVVAKERRMAPAELQAALWIAGSGA